LLRRASKPLSCLKLGGFNRQTKKYEPSVSLDDQLLSIIGDMDFETREPEVHARAVVGKRDGNAHWGSFCKLTFAQHGFTDEELLPSPMTELAPRLPSWHACFHREFRRITERR
jgi:hypothetical protein